MSSTYIISRDGKPCGITEASEAIGPLAWFHRNVMSSSMDHAIAHEGWSVTEGEPDCGDVEALLVGIAERIGLTMQADFVPFSRSRNANADSGFGDGKPWRSLNWKVKLQRNGRDVVATDYGQGVAYAPANKRDWGRPANSHLKARAVDLETESGMIASTGFGSQGEPYATRKPIPAPSIGDVLASLASDSAVLDEAGFEDWADSLGYDTDSRKAESIYRECLANGLALKAAIGGHALTELCLAASFN